MQPEKNASLLDQIAEFHSKCTKAQNLTEILTVGEPKHRTEAERLKQGLPLDSNTLQELVQNLIIPLILLSISPLASCLRITISPFSLFFCKNAESVTNL